MLNWKIEKRKLKDLKLLDNNPRVITKEGIDKLKKSIENLGDFKPVLVCDTDGVILAGNQKYRILVEKYGNDFEVNISIPEKPLTDKERKSVIIEDNKHQGSDDYDILANEYEDVLNELGYNNLLPSDIDYNKEWQGMPEFNQDNLKTYKDLIVHFEDQDAVNKFSKLINQKITDKTKYIYFPFREKDRIGSYE